MANVYNMYNQVQVTPLTMCCKQSIETARKYNSSACNSTNCKCEGWTTGPISNDQEVEDKAKTPGLAGLLDQPVHRL